MSPREKNRLRGQQWDGQLLQKLQAEQAPPAFEVPIKSPWPENQTRVPYAQWRRAEDEASKWRMRCDIQANEIVDERRARIEVERKLAAALAANDASQR
jgi:hypothetical protein